MTPREPDSSWSRSSTTVWSKTPSLRATLAIKRSPARGRTSTERILSWPADGPNPATPVRCILNQAPSDAAIGGSCAVPLAHAGSWADSSSPVSYTHLRAHETPEHLVCRLLL